MSNFQPLDVVDGGSETQPQVVGNFKFFYLGIIFRRQILTSVDVRS